MKPGTKTIVSFAAVLLVAGLAGYYFMTRTPFALQKPAVNELAPELSLADLSGSMVRLSDYRGKVILLNFWASWCPPCKAEMPGFQRVYDQYGIRGFIPVGVVLDEIQPQLVKEIGVSYPVVIINKRVAKEYGNISDVPSSILIGKDGRILKKIRGVYSEKDLAKDVAEALK